MRIDDHWGTVTPVRSFPQVRVMVLVLRPSPIARLTGGSAFTPIPAAVPATAIVSTPFQSPVLEMRFLIAWTELTDGKNQIEWSICRRIPESA
jgi:hypothetical protein